MSALAHLQMVVDSLSENLHPAAFAGVCTIGALFLVALAAEVPLVRSSLLWLLGAKDAHAVLRERRSIKEYKQAAVPAGVVTRALESAILAPNHFLTEPWRFRICGPETVSAFCALNEDKRAMFQKVPGWLVVTLKTDPDMSSKKALEDHAAVSCAVQNFQLSLRADGVGAKWMTGALGIAPDAIMKAAACPSGEHFMGVIWYGYEKGSVTKAPTRKLGLAGCLTELP